MGWCKKKKSEYDKIYRLKNLEKIREKSALIRAKNKAKKREYDKQYRAKRKEQLAVSKQQYYLRNKGKIRDYYKVWAKDNKEIVQANVTKGNIKRKRRHVTWLSAEHRMQVRQIYRTAVELTKSTGIKHHVDHIIPLCGKTVSGLHVPWNLQVITAKENMNKKNKLVLQ